MLVLSRHRDESIIIGDDIIVTVVDLRGDKVRLGISAPTEVRVDRTEVRDRINQGGGRRLVERADVPDALRTPPRSTLGGE